MPEPCRASTRWFFSPFARASSRPPVRLSCKELELQCEAGAWGCWWGRSTLGWGSEGVGVLKAAVAVTSRSAECSLAVSVEEQRGGLGTRGLSAASLSPYWPAPAVAAPLWLWLWGSMLAAGWLGVCVLAGVCWLLAVLT